MKIQQIDASFISSRPGQMPEQALPEIAFLGRSNVGKSSLINSLVNRRKLARTSKEPGRTRAIHWYRITGDGGACYFVDLPGYGYARVAREVREEAWAELIDTYLERTQSLVLAIQMLDIRRDGPTDLDLQMIEWLRRRELPVAFVLTKSDKLPRGRRATAVREFARVLELPMSKPPIEYSAVTGDGRARLWSLIDQRVCTAA